MICFFMYSQTSPGWIDSPNCYFLGVHVLRLRGRAVLEGFLVLNVELVELFPCIRLAVDSVDII